MVNLLLINIDEETQSTALRWINEFINISGPSLLKFTTHLLTAILPTLSLTSPLSSLAIETNKKLYDLVLQTGKGLDEDAIATLLKIFKDEREESRIGTLDWLIMLHSTSSSSIINTDAQLHKNLLLTLSDYSEEVAKRSLLLLAQISKNSADNEKFESFMRSLLELFSRDKRLLETRGTLVIRHLCKHLDTERIFTCLAEILITHNDIEFAALMVQNLNLILITAPELHGLRTKLKQASPTNPLFSILYKSFCHNPVSLFSLCLLSGCYEHASTIITTLGDIQITVSHLIQLDKLVQLIESPVFSSLRLHLLDPEKHSCLYKALYGILMLLPQSSAFETLRNRLECVNIATLVLPKRKDKAEWGESFAFFKTVLERHEGGKSKRGSISSSSSTNRSARTKTAPVISASLDRANKPPRR